MACKVNISKRYSLYKPYNQNLIILIFTLQAITTRIYLLELFTLQAIQPEFNYFDL